MWGDCLTRYYLLLYCMFQVVFWIQLIEKHNYKGKIYDGEKTLCDQSKLSTKQSFLLSWPEKGITHKWHCGRMY